MMQQLPVTCRVSVVTIGNTGLFLCAGCSLITNCLMLDCQPDHGSYKLDKLQSQVPGREHVDQSTVLDIQPGCLGSTTTTTNYLNRQKNLYTN